jgi:uncharacterized protein (DUF2147 family)
MLILIALALAASGPPNITGDWVTADRTAMVRIGSCGTRTCGAIIRVLAHGSAVPQTDVNNPVRARRSQSLVGLKVLSGFTPAPSGWANGRAYDPKTGRTYKARLALNRDGTLVVTGCVLFICKSQRWIRSRAR